MSYKLKWLWMASVIAMFPQTASAYTICVNPGGDNSDTINGCGIYRRDVTLNIAKKLQPMLKRAGFNVVMTRENNNIVPDAQRAALCNSQADVAISIQVDSYESNLANGVDVYHTNNNTGGLANSLLEKISTYFKIRKREVIESHTHKMLSLTSIPIVEPYMGYISNCSNDAVQMTQNTSGGAKGICLSFAEIYHGNPSGCNEIGTLSGTVTNPEGQPLSNVKVSLNHLGKVESFTTGADGKWSFELVPNIYVITLTKDGYESKPHSCPEVSAGSTKQCNTSLEPNNGTLTGKITASDNGNLYNCQVTAAGLSPNISGTTWTATGPAKTYTVTITCPGYESANITCTIASNQTSNCNKSLTALPGSLSGVVSCDGIPIQTTVIVDGGTSIQTDSNGAWGVKNLTAGAHHVKVEEFKRDEESKCNTAQSTCVVDRDSNNPNCNVNMTSEVLENPGIITGKVKDNYNNPVIGAQVEILKDNNVIHTLSTNGNGVFSQSIKPGNYSIKVNKQYYQGYTLDNCTVKENNQSSGCDIKIKPNPRTICIDIKIDGASVIGRFDIKGKDEYNKTNISSGQNIVDRPFCTKAPFEIGNYHVIVESPNGDFIDTNRDIVLPIGEGEHHEVFNVEAILSKKYTICGKILSRFNDTDEDNNSDEQERVKGKVYIHTKDDNNAVYDYDGDKNWCATDLPNNIYTVTAKPDDTNLYKEGTRECIADDECIILVERSLSAQASDTPEGTISNEEPIISYDDNGDCSIHSSQNSSNLWLILLGTLGLGTLYRRRRV